MIKYIDLLGGIVCILLGVFIWLHGVYLGSGRYSLEEQKFGFILGWVAIVFLTLFGIHLIIRWWKQKNK